MRSPVALDTLTRRSLLVTLASAAAVSAMPAWSQSASPAPPKGPLEFAPGNYVYLPGGGANPPFSGGSAPVDGYMFVRVRLRDLPPLADGLKRAAEWIKAQGRPLSALAACELRSATALGTADFASSNAEYNEVLRSLGFGAADAVPIARSNMALQVNPPPAKALYAFTYTMPIERGFPAKARDFVISGLTPKSRPAGSPPFATVAESMKYYAESTVEGLRSKVDLFGARWDDITGTQIYTLLPLEGGIDALNASGLGKVGLDLFPGHPPGAGPEFEMDARAISIERVI